MASDDDESFFIDAVRMRGSIQTLFDRIRDLESLKVLFETFHNVWFTDSVVRENVLTSFDFFIDNAIDQRRENTQALRYVIDELRNVFSIEDLFDSAEPLYIFHRAEACGLSVCDETGEEVICIRNAKRAAVVLKTYLAMFNSLTDEKRTKRMQNYILDGVRSSIMRANWTIFAVYLEFLPSVDVEIAEQYRKHCETMATASARKAFVDTYWKVD